MKRFTLKNGILLLILVGLIWLFRPFFHPLVMSLVISPLKIVLLILLLVGLRSLIRVVGPVQMVQNRPGSYILRPQRKLAWPLFLGYVGAIVVVVFFLYAQSEIRYTLTANAIDFEKRQDLPTFTPLRLMPKLVAERYASDSFQSPQEHLGDSQVALVDGKLVRVFPRLPDGNLLYFIKKMSGFVTVEVDSLDRKVGIVDQEFKYSEGVGVFDNLYYQLNLKKYFVTYSSEPIYLKNDQGKWVTVVPYMKYRGFPFTVPYWAGVMVVQSNGTITDYTPEQAQAVSYLKGNRLQPKEISEYYADAYAYKDGLLNKWFLHKDQTEVVNLPSDEVVMHVPTNEGYKQLIVAEPYGRSFGIYKIFLFDATTGKREMVEYDQNSQLTGPVAAADYIKRSFPTYNWTSFDLSEPRPLKVGGDLYWMLSIIPRDAAGIAKTVLFDSKTNQVVGFDTQDQIQAFIAGGVIPTSANTTGLTADEKEHLRTQVKQLEDQLNEIKKTLGE